MSKFDGIWVTSYGRIYRVGDSIKKPIELQALLDDMLEVDKRYLVIEDPSGKRHYTCLTGYDCTVNYPVNIVALPNQPYAETPREFPLSACTLGLWRGEEWEVQEFGAWVPVGKRPDVKVLAVYRHADLGPILETRKAYEATVSREQTIPPCPPGLTFEEAWEYLKARRKPIYYPWLWGKANVGSEKSATPGAYTRLKTVADLVGPDCFYIWMEHAEILGMALKDKENTANG